MGRTERKHHRFTVYHYRQPLIGRGGLFSLTCASLSLLSSWLWPAAQSQCASLKDVSVPNMTKGGSGCSSPTWDVSRGGEEEIRGERRRDKHRLTEWAIFDSEHHFKRCQLNMMFDIIINCSVVATAVFHDLRCNGARDIFIVSDTFN